MLTVRERFRAVARFEPFDRLPMIEWAAWWDQTIDRWRREGLPAGDRYELCRHFGLDLYYQEWLPHRLPECPWPAAHGMGIVTGDADYARLRPLLLPENAVDAARWRARAAEQERGEAALWFTLEGFFWFPRALLGIERHLYAFYDQPELMHRINRDLAAWQVRQIDAIADVCTPDFMTFAEDMSYNHGPMLSEELFDEFILPYYRTVIPHLLRRGIVPVVDSDGDITTAAPWFERAGLAGVLPLERQAGVDIGRLRAAHPRMLFIGHYDKMAMNKGEAAIRREFERLLPAAAGGGFLPSVDHQTPPGVSLADYRLYLALYREYAEEAGRRSRCRSRSHP